MPIQAFSREIDPYKNFKFRVYMGATLVAGVSKVSALKRTTEVITNRSGGMESTVVNSPGQSKAEPITLERGLALDRKFEEWANAVYSPEGDGGVSLSGMRRNLTVELLNLKGQPVMKWQVFGCWVSEYTALPELDANANAFAFETIVLQNHGFIRDTGFAGEDPAIFTPAA
ncbi:MAG: phage tail protein [Alphaproteobacteria bacterium]|nr:phage tail protein [Alphaproteobacteria bacterium]MBV9373184.1 phage tail protein [Alphaproteobacteria bacterium]MBV9900273.1 phage tail protein [Alphaproteobacteria bacterium]